MNNTNWMVKGDTLSNYLEACATADMATFKRDPRLTAIFEHANPVQGAKYLQHIQRVNPSILSNVFTNDLTGGATVTDYGNGIVYSPSTLQYIAVLANLIELCGTFDGLRIVEIGGGYGGQCKTVLDIFKPLQYHIIDLYEVTQLQGKYITDYPIGVGIVPQKESYDLFISNYALSEIPDNKAYIELAGRCKHGYITTNTDLVHLPWAHNKQPDITGEPNNFILTW